MTRDQFLRRRAVLAHVRDIGVQRVAPGIANGALQFITARLTHCHHGSNAHVTTRKSIDLQTHKPDDLRRGPTAADVVI